MTECKMTDYKMIDYNITELKITGNNVSLLSDVHLYKNLQK